MLTIVLGLFLKQERMRKKTEKGRKREREREREKERKRERGKERNREIERERERKRERERARFGRFIIGLPLSESNPFVRSLVAILECHDGTVGMAPGMAMAREERVDGPTPGARSAGGVPRTGTGSSSPDASQMVGGKTRSW